MDKRTLEAVRYLGYGKHAVDDQTLALIRDSFEDLERVAKRRIVYRIFELKVSDEEHLNIEGLEITSRNLAKNMKGCTQVVMLGATLGVEVDMLMKRYSLTEMSRTVVLQACAAAMLLGYCCCKVCKSLLMALSSGLACAFSTIFANTAAAS